MPAHVRVLLADDHPIFLDGLARALAGRAEIDLVGTARDGRAALNAVRELEPDVALLDLRMPGLSALDIVRAVRRDRLAVRVAVLSAEVDGRVVVELVQAGAAAYLSKDAGRAEIGDAVLAVARGETVIASQAQGALAREMQALAPVEGPQLSDREREVLALIADGLSGPAIASRLHLSAATVKSHTQSLYGKLGVAERAAAVAEAMRRGLLE